VTRIAEAFGHVFLYGFLPWYFCLVSSLELRERRAKEIATFFHVAWAESAVHTEGSVRVPWRLKLKLIHSTFQERSNRPPRVSVKVPASPDIKAI